MKKIALVTGGSRGIGEAVCRELAKNDYYVYINYLHSKESAEKIADEINGQVVCFDVSDCNSVKKSVNAILNENNHIDLLINNAGISQIELFTHIKQEISDDILNINLKGTLNCSRCVLPSMINRKQGNIINISSMWGQCGASCEVDYSASKAGIIGFTKSLAKEVASRNITVNAVAPGFIETQMTAVLKENIKEEIAKKIPLKRMGTTQDVANVVKFLASSDSSYITGQVIHVDGGMLM